MATTAHSGRPVSSRRPTLKRGDIVHINFDPVAGVEMAGPHFAMVLSRDEFNQRRGAREVLLAPITGGAQDDARDAGFTVSLSGAGLSTTGIVVVSKARMMDVVARSIRVVESAPDYIVDDAVARFVAILTD